MPPPPHIQFPRDYAAARTNFILAAKRAGADLTTHALPGHNGPANEELAIDIAWLGSLGAENLLLVTSGLHGIEGPAGSALQTQWLSNAPAQAKEGQHHAVVYVHALNPWGFAHHRRANQDNVDVNRNYVKFPVSEGLGLSYDSIADKLSPKHAMSWFGLGTSTGVIATLASTSFRHWPPSLKAGLKDIQDALSGGQYRHKDGLFYGGSKPTWNRIVWEAFISSHLGRVVS